MAKPAPRIGSRRNGRIGLRKSACRIPKGVGLAHMLASSKHQQNKISRSQHLELVGVGTNTLQQTEAIAAFLNCGYSPQKPPTNGLSRRFFPQHFVTLPKE